MYELECKCMLKKDGEFVLGEGRQKLLELIDKEGSISEAAKEMDMSYRHAWGIIRKIEKAADQEIVKSQRGGDKKKGSVLTPAGKELIKDYKELKEEHKQNVYRNPSLTVDGVIIEEGEILLIKRKNPPFQGEYALPGGFVEYGETVENAVKREVMEETGLNTEVDKLIDVYSSPDRDPRGHMISVTYSLKKSEDELESGSDAEKAEFFDIQDLPELAFDHEKIIADTLERIEDDQER